MSGELPQSAGAFADTDRSVRIRDQLGPCVLLSIPLGEKGPLTLAWQKLTLADMTPAYLASLNHGQNIGVSLGAASEGLCTIDVDNDECLETFLDLNSPLRESLISRGARGGNVWVRIEGECPPSAKLKLAGKPWGEWRADGNQTVIDGQHPSGRRYSDNGKRPLPIKVPTIKWPAGMPLPWEKHDPASQTNGGYESLPRPCYRLYHTSWHDGTKRRRPGVWFHNRRLTKKGENVDTDQWICAPLEILARTTVRGDLEHGRLIEFTSTSGHKKRHILPMRLFAGRGDEALGELLSLGLETSRKFQGHILEHIQGLSPQEHYAAALSTGWHGEDVFVLPDEIIALKNHPEKVWYQGRDQESPYGRAGTLSEWQANVGSLAAGNPYLIGAICAGFAGPLLYKFNVHGGMVHYLGPSTIGKTTCLFGAASVWGGGGSDGKSGFVGTWQSTAVGIEAFASLHSDTLGILDELHLVDPKVLDQASYAIANGCGKSRGNVHASMRPTKHWRVFGLSSGEVSCDTWLRSGGITVRSGQVVRMLDVPVQGTHGAFENLHGFSSGKAFAEELNRNTLRYYGHAGPAFVRKLIEENPDLDELLSKATPHFSPSEGDPALNAIQSRAARTFAIMAVAGELAALFGIVPWQEGEAIKSCVSLFRLWLGQMKASNSESPDAKILKLIASYISRFADSRFSDINGSSDDVRVNDRSGYWKDEAISEREDRRIFLFTSDALAEAARSYDIHHISAALKAAGALFKIGGDAKHLSVFTRTPHKAFERLYYIDPEKLETT